MDEACLHSQLVEDTQLAGAHRVFGETLLAGDDVAHLAKSTE